MRFFARKLFRYVRPRKVDFLFLRHLCIRFQTPASKFLSNNGAHIFVKQILLPILRNHFNSSASRLTKLRIVTNNQGQSHIGAFPAAKLLVNCFFLELTIKYCNILVFLHICQKICHLLFTWVLLKKKAENSQNMATNIRLFLNQCNKSC